MSHRTARVLIESLMGLSLCLTAACGQGLQELGTVATGSRAPVCPTRFDFEVLASAADSGKLLNLSAYRFQRAPRPVLACQGGRLPE